MDRTWCPPLCMSKCLRFGAPPGPCARRRSGSASQRNGMALGEGPAMRPQVGPRTVTREEGVLGDLQSNGRKRAAGNVCRPPWARRRLQRKRGETERAATRSARDALRQNKRCNGCTGDDRERRPVYPARLACRGDKSRTPGSFHWRAPRGQIRRVRSADFARRLHKRPRCQSTAAKTAWALCQVCAFPAQTNIAIIKSAAGKVNGGNCRLISSDPFKGALKGPLRPRTIR